MVRIEELKKEKTIVRMMRRMGPMGLMRLMRPMGLIGLMGLMGCSSDDEGTMGAGASFEVRGCVTGFEEANEPYGANRANATNGLTRAWLPPEDFRVDSTLADKTISVFFTQAAEGDYEEEYFFMSSGKWRVSKTDLEAATYYLYGYMPHDKSYNASLSKLPGDGKTFADGAVLRLENLPTVTPKDICIMIGAKNGAADYKDDPTDYSVTSLAKGDFEYVARTTTGEGSGGNLIYLLFDHLYSAMRFKIRVWKDYNALRTIKLKDLSMQAFTKEGLLDVPTTKKMNAEITLNKTVNGSDPISSPITFTSVVGEESGSGSFFESEDGEELTTEYKTFTAHFVPQGVTKLVLTSKYDVYDKNPSPGHPEGNLIRQGCEAVNTIELKELFPSEEEARRGRRYTINLTIRPTYLYMLSEPDLDNPGVTIN